MQKELDAEGLAVPVRLFAVNEVGHQAGFGALESSHTLPWLQDTAAVNAWSSWAVTYRDVVILGTQNEKLGVFNLTEHDLSGDANYDALADAFRKAAEDAAADP